MANSKETVSTEKTPLFHITKRDEVPFWERLSIRVAALILALLFCMLLSYLLIGIKPQTMLTSLWKGSFGTVKKTWRFFKELAMLLCISLAVTPAFRMKFWNIGAEGQTLIGALAAAGVSYYLGGKVPEALLLILMLIAALVVSAIWGVLPAIFKSLWNTNETLFTLMMNYIATSLVAYYLLLWTPSGSSTLGILPHGQLPKFGPKGAESYFLIILVVAVLTVVLFIYLNFTKHGYEISVVGESEKTALYIGINVKKVIVRTMTISGALCGLAGYLFVAGLDHSISVNTVGGAGFTAIMVSWLGKFNPIIMTVTSSLITFLDQGSAQISTECNIDSAFPSVIVGIILFFIIGCEFFINYKLNFRHSVRKEAK